MSLERFNSGFIIQWGIKGTTGSYWGHIVTYPITFTSVAIPATNIMWSFTTDWYTSTRGTEWRACTDIVGAPYSVELSQMGLPSYSTHYWMVIGY